MPSRLPKLPEHLPCLEIHNKSDLLDATVLQTQQYIARASDVMTLSAKKGDGLHQLKQALLKQVGWQGEAEGLFLARTRHLHALQAASQELAYAADCGEAIDLLAEHLRLAQLALSEITGEFSADDLLGVIFSRFCIGK